MMKKITLLLILLTVSFGFSQTLPFDFQGTIHSFVGNGGATVSNGTGSDVLQIVGAGAQDWDSASVTFAAPIDLSDNANNTLRFSIQSTTAAPGQVRQHGISFQGGGGAIEMNFQTTGQIVKNVELNFGSGLGSRNQMFIFIDTCNFGAQSGTGGQSGTPTGGLPSGTYIIDNMSLGADPAPTCSDGILNNGETQIDCGGPNCAACSPTCSDGILNNGETQIDCGGPNCSACPSPPTTAALIQPARAAADVVSVFSDEYTNVSPSGVEVFGPSTYINYTVENFEDTRRLTVASNGQGMQYLYLGAAPLDLSSFTTMHIDFYVEGAVQASQELQIYLINFGAWPSGAGNTNLFKNFDVNTIGSGAWYSADVALNSFAGTPNSRNKISLVQIVVNGGAGVPVFGPIYILITYTSIKTLL